MSRYELKKTIKKELRDLNWRIDMKIVRGIPYRNEARRHKFLLMQMNRISHNSNRGFFANVLGKLAV